MIKGSNINIRESPKAGLFFIEGDSKSNPSFSMLIDDSTMLKSKNKNFMLAINKNVDVDIRDMPSSCPDFFKKYI